MKRNLLPGLKRHSYRDTLTFPDIQRPPWMKTHTSDLEKQRLRVLEIIHACPQVFTDIEEVVCIQSHDGLKCICTKKLTIMKYVTIQLHWILFIPRQQDRGWGSSTLCEPHQPAETGGKLTMLIRFMGNLPHVFLILETFKRADHRGDREDDWGSNIGERKWTEWVKTEENWAWRGSQLNFSSYLSVRQEQAAASPPVSQTEERGRAFVHRWASGFHSASPHPLHQTDEKLNTSLRLHRWEHMEFLWAGVHRQPRYFMTNWESCSSSWAVQSVRDFTAGL